MAQKDPMFALGLLILVYFGQLYHNHILVLQTFLNTVKVLFLLKILRYGYLAIKRK